MIKRVITLYRHLLRRTRDAEEDELEFRASQIRHPITELEYVQAFGVNHQGALRKVVIDDDGNEVIAMLDKEDFASTFESNESAAFMPSEGSGAGGEGGNG